MSRRAQNFYFDREPGSPPPLACKLKRRVRFSEVDPMGIAWFGRYATYFEEGAAELGRCCGLAYCDFKAAGLAAPLAQYHVDYLLPLHLDEEFIIACVLVWNEGARLNTEYTLLKKDGSTASRGYTVQLLINAANGRVCLVRPPLLERCRRRWRAGGFKELQA